MVTSAEGDPLAHMLFSLGDDRPGGRFFHYFDLSANARLWGNDVKYHPLHLIRLISIALGATQLGWGILMAAIHALLFGVVYFYSRRVGRVSTAAALAGAMVAFFATSWLEWTAKVYWTAGMVLLGLSIGEYALFVRTKRRKHLLLCILANALQPYVTQSQALIPAQAYLLGSVFLMALLREGKRAQTLLPFFSRVWPLTLLGWLPILAPVIFCVGSGMTTREALQPSGWGLDLSQPSQILGLLSPIPESAALLFQKWIHLQPPNSWFFGSFLLIPALLALGQSGKRSARLLVIGAALYVLSKAASSSLQVPSALVREAGFSRLFAFPLLSGFLVAAAFDLPGFCDLKTRGVRLLHGFYKGVLGVALIGGVALSVVSGEWLAAVAARAGWMGSGALFPSLLRGTLVFCSGIAVGLAGYFLFLARGKRMGAALALAIASPAVGYGIGAGWYQRPPELDAMLFPPPELQFLRERLPAHQYRVGVVLASEMKLAQGDWSSFWQLTNQHEERVLFQIRENDLRLRQGLSFVLSHQHFYSPIHNRLRKEGNPESKILNRRNVIVRPEAELFEEYGVRYWLSSMDLEHLHPERFTRIYQGRYGTVFENPRARPVAYFLEEPDHPLPLEHVPYGIAVSLPDRKAGTLSVHLDLRGVIAHAVDSGGRKISLALKPSGRRWQLRVPEGCPAVLLIAEESVRIRILAFGAGAAFLLLFFILWIRQENVVPTQGVCYPNAFDENSRRISAALCCLNERENLPVVMDHLKRLSRQLGGRLQEVVFVDGNSTDGTWEYLKQAASEWSVLKPVRQCPPAGRGSGHRQAVQACTGETIITCGADLNYDITDAARMLPLLAQADLVVANPFLSGAGFRLNFFRKVLTHGVSFLYRLALAGRKRSGTVFTPSFRVGKADLFREAMPQSNGFTASAEFMVRVYLTTDARVVEMPVSVHPRGAGRSKLPKFRTILGHLRWFGRILAFRMGLRRQL